MQALTRRVRTVSRQRGALAAFVAAVVFAGATLLGPQSHGEFAADKQPVAWQAQLDFTDYDLAGGKSVAVRGDYIRGTWDGDLVAYNVSATGSSTVKWKAREKVPAHASRKIFTSSASGSGVAFRWSGTSAITAQQQALLGNATSGPQVLDYLRGDKTNEVSSAKPYPGGLFRQRFSTLGAIIHSRPYVRGNTVYVGANDGMMHAFDAETGVERWAYIPSMLFANGKLASLSSPLSTDFPYLVDGSMTIGSVGGKDLLVGALGDGAKGLYCLDVTSPSPSTEGDAAKMAEWEITEATTGYANLGNVITAPQLVTLDGGATVVLSPNGTNSAGKVSSLFVIKPSDGTKLAEIKAGTALADGSANGLGGLAAVDSNGDGRVDVVYAGDLKGTLWQFDVGGASYPSSATAVFTPDSTDARPITAAPSVSLHPLGGLMVNFGTGKVLTRADLSSTATEYLYGVWAKSASTPTDLTTLTLTERTAPDGVTKVRTWAGTAANYANGKKGWRIALAGGERVLGSDLITDSGRFLVTTSIPNSGSAQGGWLVQVGAVYGTAPPKPVFDLDGDGIVEAAGGDQISVISGGATTSLVPVALFLGTGAWSQPVLAQLSRALDRPFLNHNANQALPDYATVYTPPSGGVAGGHFDFDIFYGCPSTKEISKTNCGTNTHTHEYDDKYNVVGVNMLNPSQVDYNLSRAITSPTGTSFKILVANAKWSPAAGLKAGTTISGAAWKLAVSPEGFLSETPGGAAKVFTRATLTDFVYALPPDGFSNADWGTGIVRAGLIPTQTGCVRDNKKPTQAWMDGALTIQVVDASAGAADVQANAPADAGGYRLKDTSTARAKLLAQYTTFWHHGNGFCKTDAGWDPSPAVDAGASGKSSTPAPGSDDPKGTFYWGVFGTGVGTGVSGGTTEYTYNGTKVVVSRIFDGNGVTQTMTASGVEVSRVVSKFGTASGAPVQSAERARLGRLGWKEIVR